MGSVMIEENVVRAAGASYCMDEVEIVRNVEDAGFVAKRRNMHYDILGDPFFREHDVPAHAGAVDRARGRRHVGARGARELSRAQRRRQEAAIAAAHLAGLMTAYRAAWVCPIDQPPIRDGVVRVERRSHCRRRVRTNSENDGISRPRQCRALARARQRAHPSRAVVAARPRAAGAEVHRLGEAAVRDSRPAGRRDVGRAGRRDSTRRSPNCRRPAPLRSATSAIRSRPFRALQRSRS